MKDMTLEHHHHVPAGVGRRCRRAQLTDIAALVRLYEEQLLPEQVDLLTNTTVRFGDEVPTHRAWMLATNFAYEALCERRSLACVAIFHVPALAGRAAPMLAARSSSRRQTNAYPIQSATVMLGSKR
ncbi:hypothetical protein [Sphingomonas solaris]|uniref:Uncharacterized protein n=1 Tax=Alterirhizorhabdus solaris TaxID=2529389 RepID=A0A558QWE4_9SPHN|nr:hypothetical protein [Sphingomonas solaris]TVV71387.1 hypothetical protein FOY91_16980 [Sphingomonas solaris]